MKFTLTTALDVCVWLSSFFLMFYSMYAIFEGDRSIAPWGLLVGIVCTVATIYFTRYEKGIERGKRK